MRAGVSAGSYAESVPSTRLHLVFRLRGPKVNPEWLSERTGIEPHRSFHVGESRAEASKSVAGWEWRSEDGPDDEPIVEDLLAALGSHVDILRRCRDEGADISLTVVGEVRGDVVDSVDEAERRRWSVDEREPFRPTFDVDRVGLQLSEAAILFLAAVGASYYSHIDVEYEPLLE